MSQTQTPNPPPHPRDTHDPGAPALDPAATLADAPVLIAGIRHATLLWPTGESATLKHADALREIGSRQPIICHLPATAARLRTDPFPARDILELFAFARPARFCVPTPSGVAAALGLAHPTDPPAMAMALRDATQELLGDLTELDGAPAREAAAIARAMGEGGWGWAKTVLAALGAPPMPAPDGPAKPDTSAFAVWNRLGEWAEFAPEPPPESHAIGEDETRARLAALLGPEAESRPAQADYAAAISHAFTAPDQPGAPRAVLAEAGTGVGKTLGYLAPASLWAERNEGAVWISTYTRNLQRQVDQEAARLFDDPAEKARRVVVRKGRENYLCLLNLEEALPRIALRPTDAIALGLVARWAGATNDGDMAGGDFPAWLADLFSPALTTGLTERRGECVYAACAHFRKCFIERTVRKARRADIVIANHALVMVQAALGGIDDGNVPTRLVFDEGHHLFDAADSAFSADLTGLETAELRRWLRGAEQDRRSRSRGLERRIAELAVADDEVAKTLAEVLDAARALPARGWLARLGEGRPKGPGERFLGYVRQQVYARAEGRDGPYDLEIGTEEPVPGLIDAAAALDSALALLSRPMAKLTARLQALLAEGAAELDTATRNKIDAVCRGLARRRETQIEAWRAMLRSLGTETPAEFVDWLSVTRRGGHDMDAGLHRHWLDPMQPFAKLVAGASHGLAVTSASLRDATGDAAADWAVAEARSGMRHIASKWARVAVPSPFDYAGRTKVLVVGDVRKDDFTQVAAAFRALFEASGGGALGLFTAIARLREVHARIAGPLEDAGLTLLAQHVERMDTATLVDIFRADTNACLLGTDAVRDGIDVPGESLRLIVFDRVPWPRPTILHRARRAAFKDTRYDDMIARARLTQAFGRLVRAKTDRGVFVMLDPMLPSRLAGAFPEGVEIQRTGLAEAVATIRDFLNAESGPE